MLYRGLLLSAGRFACVTLCVNLDHLSVGTNERAGLDYPTHNSVLNA